MDNNEQPKRKRTLKLLTPEQWEALGLPRETLVISREFGGVRGAIQAVQRDLDQNVKTWDQATRVKIEKHLARKQNP